METTIEKYISLSLPGKINFFDEDLSYFVKSTNDLDLFRFLKNIILDTSENSYLRKSAQKLFTECVFINKIKVRQALGLLIDDWVKSSDVFLDIQRVNDLFYFYHEESQQIEVILKNYSLADDLELASEAQVKLGLIKMQKGFTSDSGDLMMENFNESKLYFARANHIVENRIDAQFYENVVSILTDLLSGNSGNTEQYLNNLSTLLFKKEVYSFDFKLNALDLGFFRSLRSIYNLHKNKPARWLNYRDGFQNLYLKISEIKNQEIKNRLNESTISSLFLDLVNSQFIDPYFSMNFSSLITQIEVYIEEQEVDSELYSFLLYIKDLAQDKGYKKKIEFDALEKSLIDYFPNRSSVAISETLKKVKDINNPLELLSIIKDLKSPSINNFLDAIISACISLQGIKNYRGDAYEDDRNTYISELLSAGGYYVKDQTKWGLSPTGKSPGEIDIMVKDTKGIPFTIIEALNLKSLDTGYIISHIDKIFTYDTFGAENNFILVYANTKKFGAFWEKYINFVSNHEYKYDFVSMEEVTDYPYSDVRISKARHKRNNKEIYIYHLGVNLALD